MTIKSIVAASMVAMGVSVWAGSEGVQLWDGGPFWAECNIGATKPEEYGSLTQFDGTSQAVTDELGADWRVPTAEDFGGLTNKNYCTTEWKKNYNGTGINGCIVTSKADPTKSIFLPAAGFDFSQGRCNPGTEGYYWSSTPNATNALLAASIKFRSDAFYVTTTQERIFGMSVRAVRDAPVYGHDLCRHKPYLHEIWYDNYVESDLTGDDAPFGDLPVQSMGGCSSVRVGNFHGRNLDIGVSDLATVVIHMKATEGRFASVGTTQWADVSETALTNGTVSAHRFDVLPSWMLDGINENGVAINVNIIPMDVPQDGDDPASDSRPALHARKVARYVLDHAESAAGVIEQLKGFRVFGNIGAVENNIHWMISDAEKTFVVEIIKGEVVAREHPIMTNFNINWDNGNQRAITDPENWGPKKYFWAAAYSNDTDTIFKTYTLHAEGIERYIRLRDSGAGYLERGKTLAGMVDLMQETQYSKIAYLPLAETYLSDLLDMQEVKDAGFGSLEDIYAASNAVKLAETWAWLRPKMAKVYEHLADYRNPETIVPYSITTHNVTFDLAQKMFRIVVQEEYDDAYNFWLFTPGSKKCPWQVGTEGHEGEVTAYTNGVGGLVVEGVGAVGSTPWTERAAEITKLVKQEGVTGLKGIVATLPALTTVNWLTLKELNDLAAGAVKTDGFSAIAVDPATQEATLSVVVSKAESLHEPDWKPVSTNDIPVKADTPTGFFIVAPAEVQND